MDFQYSLGDLYGAVGQVNGHRQMKNSVAALRAGRGWTQGDLAKHLRVSRQTVNASEAGRYDPSLPLAFLIAKLFKQRIEDIFDP